MIDPGEAVRFLRSLYPDVGQPGYVVLAHMKPGRHAPVSTWVTLPEVPKRLPPWLKRYAPTRNTYFGVALRDLGCEPKLRNPNGPVPLGGSEDVCAVPALILDVDDLRGAHSEEALPRSDAESWGFLNTLPWQPSMVVDTGGGLHVYYVFKEPYLIESDNDRETIRDLSERFRRYVIDAARERHGWKLDILPPLHVILRLPGTLNRKTGRPIPVRLAHEGDERYNPSDFEGYLPARRPRPKCTREDSHGGNLDIMVVAEHYEIALREKSRRRSEWKGANPQHGSTHDDNLNVNADKQTWRCFRCSSGGNGLTLIALCEDLIECHEARPGVFAGKAELLRRVVGIANEKFGAGIEWKDRVEVPQMDDGPTHTDDDIPGADDRDGAEQPPYAETKDGRVRETQANYEIMLRFEPKWAGRLRFNELAGMVEIDGRTLTDHDHNQIASWASHTFGFVGSGRRILDAAIDVVAHRRSYDPLGAFVQSLPEWDQTERLDTALITWCSAQDTLYSRWCSRMLFTQMIARASSPGCMARYVLVLEGDENTGKTEFVKALGEPWWVELSLNFDAKEAHMQIAGVWVVELGELGSLRRSSVERVKSFLSATKDSFIPKYSNIRTDRLRRCVFIGTTNDDDYLVSNTGNTRFLPIRTGEIDVDQLRNYRDQVLAEAKVSWEKDTQNWWTPPSAVAAQWVTERKSRQEVNVFEAGLAQWLEEENLGEVTWKKIAIDHLNLDIRDWSNKSLQFQITSALKRLGWVRGKQRREQNGTRVDPWTKPGCQ